MPQNTIFTAIKTKMFSVDKTNKVFITASILRSIIFIDFHMGIDRNKFQAANKTVNELTLQIVHV